MAGLALAIAVATLVVFGALGAHIAGGGDYEPRTIFVMSVRSLVWFAVALLAYRLLRPASSQPADAGRSG